MIIFKRFKLYNIQLYENKYLKRKKFKQLFELIITILLLYYFIQ